jgi:HEAT repeat protein
LRAVIADACLVAADTMMAAGKPKEAMAIFDALREEDIPQHLRLAALLGAIRSRGSAGLPLLTQCLRSEDKNQFRVGLRMAHEMTGSEVTQTLVDELRKLEPKGQAARRSLLVHVLGQRGDKAALPTVLRMAERGPSSARISAVRALAQLGDVSAVPALLRATVEDDADLSGAAIDTLGELPGEDVDAALAEVLETSEGRQRLVLVDLAGRRGIAAAVPALAKLADDQDEQVRNAAVAALGLTTGPDGLEDLIGRLVDAPDEDAAGIVKGALKTACLRMPDRDACAAALLQQMTDAPMPAKVHLMDLLGVVGGAKALEGISNAARDKNAEVQDAATRVLGGWMSPDAAPILLDLAKADGYKFKIRALRGYIRIIRQFGLPESERLAMCREAFSAADRDEERALVLDAMTRFPSPPALNLVMSHLDSKALRGAASTAAVSIAEKLLNDHPTDVANAMQRIMQATDNKETARKARSLLKRAKAKLPKS